MVRIWPDTVELGYGALARLPDIALSVGKSPLVLSGPGISKEISERFRAPDFVVSESTAGVVGELKKLTVLHDCIVAIGGGKVVDVGKMAAHEAGLPVISVPTVLSGDGIASPVAVIDGLSRRVSVPAALICDLEVISRAPRRHNAAGAGDLLSNISSSWDWRRARELGKDEDFNGPAAAMSELGALALLSEEPNLACADTLRACFFPARPWPWREAQSPRPALSTR